jgi:hypothetical protein
MSPNKKKHNEAETPPLPLVPEVDDNEDVEDRTKYSSFKLYAAPGVTTDTTKYVFTMRKVDGNQTIRQTLQWMEDVIKVLRGLRLQNCPERHELIQQLCSGGSLTAYTSEVNNWIRKTKEQDRQDAMANAAPRDTANGETAIAYQERLQRVMDAVPDPAITERAILGGLRQIVVEACPYKVMERQKAYMRRKMRKPREMTTRTYVNHLNRINETELPALPPLYSQDASFSSEELKEIVVHGIPNSWRREMNKFDVDLYKSSMTEIVEFCERMEASEQDGSYKEINKFEKKESSNGSSKKGKSGYKSSKKDDKKGKWCPIHETNSHDLKDCHVYKKAKSEHTDKKKSYGDGKFKPKNKEWVRKAGDAKDKAKKDLNALKKTVNKLEQKLSKVKESTAVKKRQVKWKPDDSDEDSFNSLAALQMQMEEVDKELDDIHFSQDSNKENLSDGEVA